MAHHFVPLTFALIDEGRLAAEFEAKVREAQVAVIDHLGAYGDKARKAKAKVRLDIEMVCLDPEDRTFGVIGQVEMALPKPPACATLALADQDVESGLPLLLVRKSGSTDDDPRQGVLATKDGRAVDARTGKAAEAPKKAP